MPRETSARKDSGLNLLAVVYAAVLGLYVLLSQFLAPVAPFSEPRTGEAEGFARLLERLPLPAGLAAALRGESTLQQPLHFATVYTFLLVLATACWVGALLLLQVRADRVDEATPPRLFRWSVLFALIAVFATPVLVHDFWLSIAWGREVAARVDPYYASAARAVRLRDLPLRGGVGRATYGPLWELISGAVVFICRGNLLAAAVLFKLVIAAAWIAAVRAIWALMEDRPAVEQCTAIVLFAWAPLGLVQGIGDGHNDLLLICPMVLWLWWMQRSRPIPAGLALAASVLVKYVTAPLFALHIARAVAEHRSRWRGWLTSLIAAGLLVAAVGAIFYRSPAFFDATVALRAMRFFTPGSSAEVLARWAGLPTSHLSGLVNLSIIALALLAVLRYLRHPAEPSFRSAALWTMCGVLLATVGHVWPWFLLWVLALAAIQPYSRLSLFVAALAAAAAFVLIPWTVLDESKVGSLWLTDAPGVAMYAAATLALAVRIVGEQSSPRWRRFFS